MNQSEEFWEYTQKPNGECPHQAEGKLKSGEKFYFRVESGRGEMHISGMHARHGLHNTAWRKHFDVPMAKPRKDTHSERYDKEVITSIIDALIYEYVLSVEGTEFDENEIVDTLGTWYRREYIKQRREKK